MNSTTKELEEDVYIEKQRVLHEGKNSNDILRTENLTKLYRKRNTLAVDGLTFGVKEGECFGLLGVNGAGKTSTFKMLTGDSSISAGDAFIKGYSLRTNMRKANQFIGYCPQFDALDEILTGKEILMYYARIRGMSKNDAKKMTEGVIEALGLTQYKDRSCGDYSGGNKRRLSTAFALLGSPPIIFLDEPTTGMDPGARRHLWNVVSGLLSSGKSVVLTSHSMEECEKLCTRLGIMVNGKFQCLGSPQHLRNKYGMGYTLLLRAKQNCLESVLEYVNVNITNAVLKNHHYCMLEYQIPKENLLLSHVFHKLEQLRKTNSIEDYSISQTTLDQIFVSFARKQIEAVELVEPSLPLLNDIENELRMEDWTHTNHVLA